MKVLSSQHLRGLLCLVFSLFTVLNAAKTQENTAYFNSFDGTKIAYTDDGFGWPVFLIHGFINDGGNWRRSELYTNLLAAGYRVIIPDLRGNGRSDSPVTALGYAQNAEVKDIAALANHLGINKYYAVGYSRGTIVLAALLTYERGCRKAVLGGMGADCTDPEWPRRLAFADAFLDASKITDETKGAVAYASSIDRDLQNLGWQQVHQPVPDPVVLQKFRRPVLVLAGDEDHDNGDPKALAALFKKGRLQIIPGDHNNTYKGSGFAKAVLRFFGE